MTQNAIDTAFGELLHLNLRDEFEARQWDWTRERLAAAYERALHNTLRDGAPRPQDGSLEATLLRLPVTAARSLSPARAGEGQPSGLTEGVVRRSHDG